MNRKKFLGLLALLSMTLFTTPLAVAQTFTLTVFVKDAETLTPIEGAGVTVQDASGAVVASGTTDATGKVDFTLAAGTYTVTTTVCGFLPKSTSVVLDANKTITLLLRAFVEAPCPV